MALLEEAKRRDHRKLGKELDLFSIHEDVGPGLICWHPKGALIRTLIEDFWRGEHIKAGYNLVFSPHIAKMSLWGISGHLDFYQDNMYSPMDVEGTDYIIKPMNCPFHIKIYKNRLRSYRELPFRMAELGTVYRYERSGVLHGLLRVRGFTQDDAHIFCTKDQLNEEIARILNFTLFVLRTFGFSEYDIYLSTRPEKFTGTEENWEKATAALRLALEQAGLPFEIDPGEGVFYGPKIDIKIKDSLGRSWQCSTIQVDFNIPQRFEMEYRGSDGQSHQPIMIHRALMGSMERFLGCLIEHYAGAFPAWLSPVQVVVMSITDAQKSYVEQIYEELLQKEIRAEADTRNEKLGFKIRESRLNKIPFMLIAGEKEREAGRITLRERDGQETKMMVLQEAIEKVYKACQIGGEGHR